MTPSGVFVSRLCHEGQSPLQTVFGIDPVVDGGQRIETAEYKHRKSRKRELILVGVFITGIGILLHSTYLVEIVFMPKKPKKDELTTLSQAAELYGFAADYPRKLAERGSA